MEANHIINLLSGLDYYLVAAGVNVITSGACAVLAYLTYRKLR